MLPPSALDVLRVEHEAMRGVLARLTTALAEADFARSSGLLAPKSLALAYHQVLAHRPEGAEAGASADPEQCGTALHRALDRMKDAYRDLSMEVARKAREREKIEGRSGSRSYSSFGS